MTVKEIVIPPAKDTWAKKWAYLHAAREKSRRDHNAKGQLVRDGKMTDAEWRVFLREVFAPREDAITEAMSAIKHYVDAVDLSEIDLETSFRDKT